MRKIFKSKAHVHTLVNYTSFDYPNFSSRFSTSEEKDIIENIFCDQYAFFNYHEPLEEVIRILKELNIYISIYSNYFHTYFRDEEEYNEYARKNNNVDLFNLAKYEKIEYTLSIYNDDFSEGFENFRHENESFIEYKQETFKKSLELLIKDLEEINDLIDDFNNCETVEDLANIDNYNVEYLIQYICECDSYHNEESLKMWNEVEAIKKYNKFNAMLSVKEEVTTTKKTKI